MHKVAQLLASSLGASFSLQAPADKQWGAITIKGLYSLLQISQESQSFIFHAGGTKVWDGMMGLVFDDKVDAAVGTIFYLKGNTRKIIEQYFFLNVSNSGSSFHFRASRSHSKHLLNLCCAKVKDSKIPISLFHFIYGIFSDLEAESSPGGLPSSDPSPPMYGYAWSRPFWSLSWRPPSSCIQQI